jgi:hypothetical protein
MPVSGAGGVYWVVNRFSRIDNRFGIVRPPKERPWAPGYYSNLFDGPAGIRLEINHVPGKGALQQGSHFIPAGNYQ